MRNEVKLLPCEAYVLGPISECDEFLEDGSLLWQAEVQTMGGYEVVATIYGTEDSARQMAEQAIAAWNTRPTTVVTDEVVERAGFAPCPTCKQYSHSIGDDQLTAAFRHFQSMYAHPVRGHPMGDNFDEQTRDAAQVLMAAAMPTVVTGEQPLQSVGDHALPCSASSPVPRSRPKAAAAIAREKR